MKTRKEIESEIARLQGLLKKLPESGKWYFVDGFLFQIIERSVLDNPFLSEQGNTCYLRDVTGKVCYTHFDASLFIEAEDYDVQKALTKKAIEKYGDNWMNVKIKEHADGQEWTLKEGEFASGYSNNTDRFYNRNGVLYHDGRWAKAAPTVSVGDWMFLRGRGFKLVGSENQGKALLGSGWSVVTDFDMIFELDKYNG